MSSKEFEDLVDELVATGMNKTQIVGLLGYAGSPGRNLKSVVEGRSKLYTRQAAIEELKKTLDAKKKKKVAQQPSADDPDTDDAQMSALAAYGAAVRKVVTAFELQDVVPADASNLADPDKVPAAVKSLSMWYDVVTKAKAFEVQKGTALPSDRRTRATELADEVIRLHKVQKGKVRLWMSDNAGYIVHQLLKSLLTKGWSPDDIDTRLRLSLFSRVKAMNDYHERAIPCAKALRGDVHDIIAANAAATPGRLPHLVYFNFSKTASDGTKKAEHEQGGWKGKFRTVDCMTWTAHSCKKVLRTFPQAGLLVSFPVTRGGAKTLEKMEPVMGASDLSASEVKSVRDAYLTFKITKE